MTRYCTTYAECDLADARTPPLPVPPDAGGWVAVSMTAVHGLTRAVTVTGSTGKAGDEWQEVVPVVVWVTLWRMEAG